MFKTKNKIKQYQDMESSQSLWQDKDKKQTEDDKGLTDDIQGTFNQLFLPNFRIVKYK